MEKRTASHDEASRALMGDLRAIMPKGADEAWASFERRRHRRIYLHQDGAIGVGVDLIEVARTEKVDSVAGVKDVLGPYELELDRLLLARALMLEGYGKRMADQGPGAAGKAYKEVWGKG